MYRNYLLGIVVAVFVLAGVKIALDERAVNAGDSVTAAIVSPASSTADPTISVVMSNADPTTVYHHFLPPADDYFKLYVRDSAGRLVAPAPGSHEVCTRACRVVDRLAAGAKKTITAPLSAFGYAELAPGSYSIIATTARSFSTPDDPGTTHTFDEASLREKSDVLNIVVP